MAEEEKKEKKKVREIIKRERSGVELWEPNETKKPDIKPSTSKKKEE